MPRTLVVAPSWIGDAVLSHPLLMRLKEFQPTFDIDVLAPPWVAPVYRRMPEVAATIDNPFGHGQLRLGERRRFAKSLDRYDRAIVLPNTFKSALIPWYAGIRTRTGYRGEMRYGVLNDLRALDDQALPLLVERYAALAQPAGEALRMPLPQPRLQVDEVARTATLKKLDISAAAAPITVMAPGAEYGPAKRWPARHFAELAMTYAKGGAQVLLLGSSMDAAITEGIRDLSGNACRNLAGQTSLDEAIDLMSLAARVITNDSGLMHVAAALDRPMAAIFGSSSPAFTPPLSSKARVITLKLSCSPCFQRVCPLGHTNCLETLLPGRVLEELG